jgi:Fe2+ or Zn2+ uptake regulation protein
MYMTEAEAKKRIQGAGFRATKPRVSVLLHLAKNHEPQSIVEVAKELRREVDPVTVYRIMGSFLNAGLVRQVDLRTGYTLFEIADTHDHHHIVCTECGHVEDFTGCFVEKIESSALSQTKSFTKVSSHSVELFGTCNSCLL